MREHQRVTEAMQKLAVALKSPYKVEGETVKKETINRRWHVVRVGLVSGD